MEEGPNALYNKSRDRVLKYECDAECKKEIGDIKEHFYSPVNSMLVLTLVIVGIFIQLTIGKYIWNNVINKLVPGTKKMNSIIQMFLLIVFIQIIGYCCY